jgi:hypothetical protein
MIMDGVASSDGRVVLGWSEPDIVAVEHEGFEEKVRSVVTDVRRRVGEKAAERTKAR